MGWDEVQTDKHTWDTWQKDIKTNTESSLGVQEEKWLCYAVGILQLLSIQNVTPKLNDYLD